MFVLWGKRVIRDEIGFVADFCPMCREPRPFVLNKVRLVSHIYYIHLGGGEQLGHEIVCQACEVALRGEPARYVATSKRSASVAVLAETSFPTLREVYAERLRIEESIRRAPDTLPGEVRNALIGQPFVLLSPLVEARFKRGSIDRTTGIVLAGTVLAFGLILPLVETTIPYYGPEAVVALSLVCACAVLWSIATNGRRFHTAHHPAQDRHDATPAQAIRN